MHELSIVTSIVDTIESYMKENSLTECEEIVLQIGELSDVIPEYLQACYQIAVEGTIMENTALKIEKITALAKCKNCGEEYRYIENKGACPKCKSIKREITQGKEFFIKQITAR